MSRYTPEQAAAMEERYMMWQRQFIHRFLDQNWKNFLHSATAAQWTDEVYANYHTALQNAAQSAMAYLEQNGEDELGSLAHQVQCSLTSMRRFLTLTSAATAHPWLARMAMTDRGLDEGDMLNPQLRDIGSQFNPSEMPYGHSRNRRVAGRPRV